MAYIYSRTVTVDYTKVGGSANLSNFPMYFSETIADLKTTANGGHVENANGYDIIFSSTTDSANKLDFEVESYDPATGQLSAWVEISSLSYTANTVIYLLYGDSSISTSQQNKTGTWNSSFRGVYHMSETTGSAALDSTSNGYDLTNTNSIARDTGKLGYSASGGTANTNKRLTRNTAMGITTGNISISCWFKYNTVFTENGVYEIVHHSYDASSENSIDNRLMVYYWDAVHAFRVARNGSTTGQKDYTFTPNTTDWYHLVYVWNGSIVEGYFNGTSIGTVSGPTTVGNNSVNGIRLFTYQNLYNWASGRIDEVRVLNTALTAGWITTEYNNQNSPSTFYAVGSEVGGGGGSPAYMPKIIMF